MAIDTESKRRSVQGYTFGLMRPVPDGAIAEADRAAATWLYSGLDYGAPEVGGLPLAWFNTFYQWFWMR